MDADVVRVGLKRVSCLVPDDSDDADDVLQATGSQPADLGSVFLRGLDALPRRSILGGEGLFVGDLRGGKEHMRLVRQCKMTKCKEQRIKIVKEGYQALEGAWNDRVVRVGDTLGEQPSCGRAPHPNEFSPNAVLRHAWRSIGKSLLDRDGVDGTHHALGIVASVAGAFQEHQNAWVQKQWDDIARRQIIPFITRHYDASSNRMRFGALQDALIPHARYAVLNAAC